MRAAVLVCGVGARGARRRRRPFNTRAARGQVEGKVVGSWGAGPTRGLRGKRGVWPVGTPTGPEVSAQRVERAGKLRGSELGEKSARGWERGVGGISRENQWK